MTSAVAPLVAAEYFPRTLRLRETGDLANGHLTATARAELDIGQLLPARLRQADGDGALLVAGGQTRRLQAVEARFQDPRQRIEINA